MTTQMPAAYVNITDAQSLDLDPRTVHHIIEMLQQPVTAMARSITAAPVTLTSDEPGEPGTHQVPAGEAICEAIQAEVCARVVGLLGDDLPSSRPDGADDHWDD